MWPHRRQPTRFLRPWDSPGRNTGVGCHFLLHGGHYAGQDLCTHGPASEGREKVRLRAKGETLPRRSSRQRPQPGSGLGGWCAPSTVELAGSKRYVIFYIPFFSYLVFEIWYTFYIHSTFQYIRDTFPVFSSHMWPVAIIMNWLYPASDYGFETYGWESLLRRK